MASSIRAAPSITPKPPPCGTGSGAGRSGRVSASRTDLYCSASAIGGGDGSRGGAAHGFPAETEDRGGYAQNDGNSGTGHLHAVAEGPVLRTWRPVTRTEKFGPVNLFGSVRVANQRSRIEDLRRSRPPGRSASEITNRHEQPRHGDHDANRAEVNDQMVEPARRADPASTEDLAGQLYANTAHRKGRDRAATITGRTSSTGGAMAFSAALNSINASQPATVDSGAYGIDQCTRHGRGGRPVRRAARAAHEKGLPRGQKVQAQSPAPSLAEGASVLPPSAVRRRPPAASGGA